jgi:ketosteroid isomerase-like protein
MTNVELVKQGYQYFAEGNIEAVLGVFNSDIEWNACIGFPFVSGDGLYTGREAVAQNIFAQLPEYYQDFHIDIQEFIGSGDKVVMVGYYTGIWKATGKKFKANATHVWTVKDGKMARYFQAVDTAEIIS